MIRCDTDNDASANVARRAGFELEGTLRNDGRKHDGRLRSTLIFSQIRPE
jgi:ribosomal-protein-serine acetyltransferase